MRIKVIAVSAAISATLTACGKPDNSGIFVATSQRQATLVQLVQTADGRLTGRVEDVTVQPEGQIKDEVSPLEGAASGHDLTLTSKPVSFLPGVSMTGRMSGGTLTLIGQEVNIQAQRSSLSGYQAAVARLRTLAQTEQTKAAEVSAAQDAQAVEDRRIQAIANTMQSLSDATGELRRVAANLGAGLDQAPDFGQRAGANTARVNELALRASTATDPLRYDLGVKANDLIVDTNNIAVARDGYALKLDGLTQSGNALSSRIDTFCTAPSPAFVQTCKDAAAASVDFKAIDARGQAQFHGYNQAIKAAIAAQSAAL